MSRRHHGGRSHRGNGHGHGQAPLASTQAAPGAAPAPRPAPPPPAQPDSRDSATASGQAAPDSQAVPDVATGPGQNGHDFAQVPMPERFQGPRENGGPTAIGSAGCTAPQLRRFIKSRPYVPMHELRRRFGINGAEDDVTVIEVDGSRVYVGLPAREGGLLGELLRGGEVGYELSLDPRSPIVVGLYPMRPVPRT